MKTASATESTQLAGASEHTGSTGDARRVEQEEGAEEPFEATIIRLDVLALERLFRLAGEW